MDIESRWQKMEAEVHQTRILVWIVLALVLALSVGLLPAAVNLGLVLVVLALLAMAHLLVSAASGLRRFWTSRAAGAQLQDKILREVIAERAKTRDQGPNP